MGSAPLSSIPPETVARAKPALEAEHRAGGGPVARHACFPRQVCSRNTLTWDPRRLYSYPQSHCGLYRLDRPGEEWTRIGSRMSKKVGDIGFSPGAPPARSRHDEQDRIRPHIRFFVAGEPARSLSHQIGPEEDVHIVCALSGGRGGKR